MNLSHLASEPLPPLCLVPIRWTRSAIVLPDGSPYACKKEDFQAFSEAEEIDTDGRTVRGRFVPKGTKAIVHWPQRELHKVPDSEEMFMFLDGKVQRVRARGLNERALFIEIDEDAAGMDRENLVHWLSSAYDNTPARDRAVTSGHTMLMKRAQEPSHLN